jgi:hypothetical protein
MILNFHVDDLSRTPLVPPSVLASSPAASPWPAPLLPRSFYRPRTPPGNVDVISPGLHSRAA